MKKFFSDLFKDNNDINEKSFVGFLAFLMMIVTLAVDIYTGLKNQEMPINEFVFDGFLYISIGAFGIASIDKWIVRKNKTKDQETTDENNEE